MAGAAFGQDFRNTQPRFNSIDRFPGSFERIVRSPSYIDNPRQLAAAIRNPFNSPAETNSSSEWCAPGHWTPWNGNFAFDIWKDNGAPGNSTYPNETCNEDVYLRVSPSALPGGTVPDRITAKVINVSYHPYGCSSQIYADGGYQQAFEIWAYYGSDVVPLGWVLFAHLDNLVYEFGDEIEDPMNVRIGTVFNGNYTSDCWGGCHLHLEFFNYDYWAPCYDVCKNLPEEGIPTLGLESIIARLGGDESSTDAHACPVFTNDEKWPCATWDEDLAGCDRHGGNPFWVPGGGDPNVNDDTQDCAYYTSTDKCRPRGTSNCQAGLEWECDYYDAETYPCSYWDNNLYQCDRHGGNPFWSPPGGDPNVYDDTQDCAYYVTSDRCAARGTSNCAAGIECSGIQNQTVTETVFEDYRRPIVYPKRPSVYPKKGMAVRNGGLRR